MGLTQEDQSCLRKGEWDRQVLERTMPRWTEETTVGISYGETRPADTFTLRPQNYKKVKIHWLNSPGPGLTRLSMRASSFATLPIREMVSSKAEVSLSYFPGPLRSGGLWRGSCLEKILLEEEASRKRKVMTRESRKNPLPGNRRVGLRGKGNNSQGSLLPLAVQSCFLFLPEEALKCLFMSMPLFHLKY